jgi:hypothetical protein
MSCCCGKWVLAILRVIKIVMLLRERGDMVILRVRKDVMLLWEMGIGYTEGN